MTSKFCNTDSSTRPRTLGCWILGDLACSWLPCSRGDKGGVAACSSSTQFQAAFSRTVRRRSGDVRDLDSERQEKGRVDWWCEATGLIVLIACCKQIAAIGLPAPVEMCLWVVRSERDPEIETKRDMGGWMECETGALCAYPLERELCVRCERFHLYLSVCCVA